MIHAAFKVYKKNVVENEHVSSSTEDAIWIDGRAWIHKSQKYAWNVRSSAWFNPGKKSLNTEIPEWESSIGKENSPISNANANQDAKFLIINDNGSNFLIAKKKNGKIFLWKSK